ncbi:hypothetical protein CR513_14335, partial [Mucuna pruriens]
MPPNNNRGFNRRHFGLGPSINKCKTCHIFPCHHHRIGSVNTPLHSPGQNQINTKPVAEFPTVLESKHASKGRTDATLFILFSAAFLTKS